MISFICVFGCSVWCGAIDVMVELGDVCEELVGVLA
jgi:hypothetical protein